jgi:DNA-binding MarR family transcriptional regulator
MTAPRRVPTAGYLVWHLSLKWRVAVDRVLSPLGLTHAHYSLLASLYALSRGGARPSQRELADFSGLEVMYVSKLVRALARSGLVRRTDHPEDPRAFQLAPTAQGADLAVEAASVVRQLYDRLLLPTGGWSGRGTRTLMRMLEGLLDQAEAWNESGEAVPAPSRTRTVAKRRRSA